MAAAAHDLVIPRDKLSALADAMCADGFELKVTAPKRADGFRWPVFAFRRGPQRVGLLFFPIQEDAGWYYCYVLIKPAGLELFDLTERHLLAQGATTLKDFRSRSAA
jgi:hypothetical protein